MLASLAPTQPDWLNYGDATNVVRLIGIVIPILTALVTRTTAPKRVKSLTTAALSLTTGCISYLIAAGGHGYNWSGFVNAILNTYGFAIISYYGLHKPTGLTTAVAHATGSVGIGSPSGQAGDGAHDGGYTTVGTLGVVLLFIGIVLLLLTLAQVFVVSIVVCVVLIIAGVFLMALGGRL
jgi:hypothetical protein